MPNDKNPKQPHKKICGAKAKSTGEPCKLVAGYGTDHLGEGRCKFHGGASKGPGKKNKNAVSTGEYETIWLETLDDNEKKLFAQIETEVLPQLENEIKLIEIREYRMMSRIKNLKKKEFTLVEHKTRNGTGAEGPINITEKTRKATLGQIQDIEDALTRVQRRKEKFLKLKHDIENGVDDEGNGSMDALAEAIEKSAKLLQN